MKIGLGHLRMRPDDFWKMTLPEFFAATDGYLESVGANSSSEPEAPSVEEVESLFARLSEDGRFIKNG